MSSDSPLRVLHCPWNIGGHPGTLAKTERELGLHSHAVELLAGPYRFQIDETLSPPGLTTLQQERARWRLLWRAVREFDVVHFNFGQSLLMGRLYPDKSLVEPPKTLQDRLLELYWRWLWMADLPLLKLAGKRIAMTYQGGDARPGDGEVPEAIDRWKRKAIARVARYADRIYALNPDLLHVLPSRAQFLPYANVDLADWTPTGPTGNARPLVVHAPTNTAIKGTSHLLAAVDRLHREGVPFEFRLIEKLTQAEARKAYAQVDLLVDQLLLGWYGGVAVEAMALGKPVVCSIREEDLRFIPPTMRAALPIIQATPTTIYQVLKDLLTNRRAELPDMGRQSRRYVETWHDPRRVAGRVAADYAVICRRA